MQIYTFHDCRFFRHLSFEDVNRPDEHYDALIHLELNRVRFFYRSSQESFRNSGQTPSSGLFNSYQRYNSRRLEGVNDDILERKKLHATKTTIKNDKYFKNLEKMIKTADFSSSAHPTTSSTTSHYSPLIGAFEEKSRKKSRTFHRDCRLILDDETVKEPMVDTITTDGSVCGADDVSSRRSNSTMGSSSNVPERTKRRGFGGVTVAVARNVHVDDDDVGAARRNSEGGGAEWTKAIFLFAFLFVAGVSNWAVLAYTHDFVPRDPLPDLVFSLVPEQRWASSLGDGCVALCIVFLAALLLVHQHRGTILKRVVFCAATLYAMRSVTLAVTQLPSGYMDNSVRCRERVRPQFAVFMSRLIEQTIRIGFQSKDSMLCGDLLFSGHTLVMVTCSLAIAYYLPRSIKPLQWLAHTSCFVGMVCMIVSRTHYTIDVIIAYWLSNMVFRIYHAYCEVDMCMERQKSILYSWWPCRIIDWLEENIVPGRLENRCHLPPILCATWRRRRRDVTNVGNSSSESSTCEPTTTMSATTTTSQQHHKHVSISSSSTYQLPC